MQITIWGCSVALWGCSVAQWLAHWAVDPSPGFDSHPVTPPPPVQPRSRSYHSARSGPALDDSRDEYCIIKYV